MTACVKNHSKRVALAISASLVGALTLGAAAPAVAFADNGVSMLATGQDVLDGADVTEAVFENGAAITDLDSIEVAKADAAKLGDIQLHTVKLDDDILTSVGGGANAGFELKGYQWANADGTFVDYDGTNYTCDNMAELFDDYFVPNQLTYAVFEVTGNATYAGGYVYVPFTMVAESLDGSFLIENGNISDTTFQWTGNALDLGIALNDTVLDKADDYNIEVRNVGSKDTDTALSDLALHPGTYVATVKGKNDYVGSELKITFEVGKLDLSQLTVFVDYNAFSGSNSRPLPSSSGAAADYLSKIYVNGSEVDPANFDLTYVSGPDGQQGLVSENGPYTYALTINNPAYEDFVTSEKTVTIDKVGSIVGTGHFLYDGDTFGDEQIETDYNSLNPDFFDVNDIKVKTSTGKELPFAVKVYDEFYNEATLDDLKTSGTWHVFAVIDSANEDVDYAFGGMSNMMTVTVKNARLSSANVVFAYDGQNMDTTDGKYTEATYDGTDLMEHIAVSVKDNKGNVLTQGEDYTLTIKDEDGKIVDEIVDAGDYVLSVSSPKYDFEDGDCALRVNPARIASLDVSNMTKFGDKEFFPYTGSAIEPEFVYATTQEPTASDYKALPDVYKVEYWYTEMTDVFNENGELVNTKVTFTKVGDMTQKGSYVLVVVPDEDAEGVDNFLFDTYASPNPIDNGAQMPWTTATVKDARVFNDVPTDYWAAEDIFTANEKSWMNGYDGTDFFGPRDNIKRGDVAVVLWKMAGKPKPVSDENYQQEDGSYLTGFADQVRGMYYNQAIAWAKSVGIVSGDTGTNMFRAEDTISRQELAKMLAVYAEKCGEDVSTDVDAVLGGYEDAGTVSEWAEGYVAYLVEAGVMGNNSPLRGTDAINRAEVATMVVRLSELFDFELIK
ncbi:S-layer homology domain-containing protein [Enorma phocaeensis]|uniref:S-layer homology domain-containing protein n=1 Tax=Enorma phocaeensis TaxID=1871019 RepID=A0ABT7VBR1_9ACTN|nr:S-layer homology domain-containing protein [Enorma phocaeensis]MDM8275824.1 S-layer homology domain-containing protein [Enorma phocaeensis]